MAFPTGWTLRGSINIPASQISGTGTLTDFPAFLDGTALSPTGVFDASTGCRFDAGDLRITSDQAGTTQLPMDVAWFDKTNSKASIHVKASLDGTNGTTLYLWWIGPSSTEVQPSRDSTYGGEAVWTDYEGAWLLYGDAPTMDRTAQNRHHYYGYLERTGRSYVEAASKATKYVSHPSMIRLANKTVLLAYRDNADIHGDDVDGYITIQSSTDGITWSALSTVGASDLTYDYRDPNLYQDDDGSGTVYLVVTLANPSGSTGSNRTIKYFRSTDNGATWDSGTTLTATNGQGRGKPLRLESGLIAVPWYEIDSSAQQRPKLTTINPADQTKTDYTVNATWNSYNEWTLTEDTSTNPNTVRGYFRSVSADNVYTSTASVDALGTWGTFTSLITTSDKAPPEAQRISTGDILIAFSYERAITPLNGAGVNVQVRRSTDNGASVTTTDFGYLVVEDEPIASGAGYYPTFCEMDSGRFLWAIYADTVNNVYPSKIITGTFRLDADGKLTGWTNTGAVPIQGSNTGGTNFIADTNYTARQADATNPLNYPHQYATFTMGALVKLDNYTAAGSQGIISTAAASADKGFLFDYEGTNDQIRVSRYLGGSSVVHTSNNNAIADNNYHVVHASISAGAPTFYVDGTSKGGSGTGTGTTTGNATRATNIGRYNHSTPGGFLDGRIGWVYCRKSAISSDWAKTEADNWAAPAIFAVGGKVYTLTADTASYTTTGNDAALTLHRTLSAGTGAFSTTFSAAALNIGRLLTANSASYSTSFADAGLTYTPAGTVAYSLLAEPVAYSTNFSASALTYTGDVTLTQADLDAIAASVWSSVEAVSAHAKLDAILARLTC